MKIKRIDHIGVVVNDIESAKQFFVDFGFTVQGEAEEQSELLDKVTGIKNSKSQIVFMEAPNGQINLELAKADAGLAYYTLLKSTGKLNK